MVQKQLVKNLLSGCKSHDDWLIVIRFGLVTLLQDQSYFIGLVMDEAERNSTHGKPDVEDVAAILDELGLAIVIA